MYWDNEMLMIPLLRSKIKIQNHEGKGCGEWLCDAQCRREGHYAQLKCIKQANVTGLTPIELKWLYGTT